MFDKFTASARHVVVSAQEHARALRHPSIGTEHLLLALLEPPSGVAATVLRDAGVDADRLREQVARRNGPERPVLTDADAEALQTIGIDLRAVLARIEESLGPDALAPAPRPPRRRGFLRRREPASGGPLRFGPRAKEVLELSLREALALHSPSLGAEHVLLALLREGDGLAAAILTDAGVDLPALRRATLAALSSAA